MTEPSFAPARRLGVLELFAGIGGVATVLGSRARIVAAVDQSRPALAVHRAHHDGPTVAATVQSLSRERLEGFAADLWWLSPPCQPFTRRGRGRDLDDPRSAGLKTLLPAVGEIRPRYVALENVPGFRASRAHDALRRTLEQAGYGEPVEVEDCPSRLGWPNLRRRFYVLASRDGALAPESGPEALLPGASRPPHLRRLLDPDPDPSLRLDPTVAARYEGALDVVEPDDPGARAACFTAAYGRSPVRSGSYLRTADGGLRRFSPAEILRILGFPARCAFPPEIPRSLAWRLAGNSLSLPPVAALLSRIPELTPRPAGAPVASGAPRRVSSPGP